MTSLVFLWHLSNVNDDAPAMSAADAPTKSVASIESQPTANYAAAANNAVDNAVLLVEDQPAADINLINMAASTYEKYYNHETRRYCSH
jgi:hypothetical protein